MQALYSTSIQKLSKSTYFLQKNNLTGPCDMMSKPIKDLSVSSSLPISFEVERHSSQSNILKGKKNKNTKI